MSAEFDPILGALRIKDLGTIYSAGTGLTLTGSSFSLTAPVSIANGGTGSITQNFVDLSTIQSSIGGAKTFTSAMSITGSADVTQLTIKNNGTQTASTMSLVRSDNSVFATFQKNASGGDGLAINSPLAGTGLYLQAVGSGTKVSALRIVGNAGAWTDAVDTAYFQIDYNSTHNASILSGTYGADANFSRLQFVSAHATISNYAFTATPVPTAVFEVQNSNTSNLSMLVVGNQNNQGQVNIIGEADVSQLTVQNNGTQTSPTTSFLRSDSSTFGTIAMNASAGDGLAIRSPLGGTGLFLEAIGSGSNVSFLRIVGNGGGWTDNSDTAYFQIDYHGTHNATIQSGTYGADANFTRLQFASSHTTMSNYTYNNTPVPTAVFEVQNNTNGTVPMLINAASGQSADLLDINVNASKLTWFNSAGVYFPVQAPTASAPTYVKGGMYFDTTLNKLRIGGAAAWETVTST